MVVTHCEILQKNVTIKEQKKIKISNRNLISLFTFLMR